MFSKLTVFQTAHAMALHAGSRQALIAQNVANADTPGYRARDLPEFSEVMDARRNSTGAFRGATTAQGISPTDIARLQPIFEASESPNRNGVSLEDEMVRAAVVKKDHGRALGIYRSAMTVLRMSLGSR